MKHVRDGTLPCIPKTTHSICVTDRLTSSSASASSSSSSLYTNAIVVQLKLSRSDTTAIEICESCGLVRTNVANSALSDTSGDVQNCTMLHLTGLLHSFIHSFILLTTIQTVTDVRKQQAQIDLITAIGGAWKILFHAIRIQYDVSLTINDNDNDNFINEHNKRV